MPLDLSSVGRTIGPVVRAYTRRDAALYGLAVGAGFSEPRYCREEDLGVLPVFGLATVFDLFWAAADAAGPTPEGVLHGEQDLVFRRPIPPEGTLSALGRITGIYDKGPKVGALIEVDLEVAGADQEVLFTGKTAIIARMDGGFGGPNPRRPGVEIPDRPPDRTVSDRPGDDQPLLYRLTGDRFPLHDDPEFAARAGFDRPIMHGLCTLGYASRALIGTLAPGAPDRVRRIGCRFAGPLYPGMPIETRIWETGPGSAVFRTIDVRTGGIVLDRGIAAVSEP